VCLRGAIEWHFEGAKGVCPVCTFPADIQGFMGRKHLGFGLKTRCLDGTLKEKKIFGLFI